jgi:hypothetical protein
MFVEIEIDPSYVLGGYPNNSLMYVTTSKGHLSTSFLFDITTGIDQSDPYNSAKANRIFNYYPQKGTTEDTSNKSSTPQITTIFQNFWFGGTRQPATAIGNEYIPPNCSFSGSITSYYQFDNDKIQPNKNSRLQFKEYSLWVNTPINFGSTSPTFDIELTRTGLSAYSLIDEPFKKQTQLVFDGRGKLNSFEENATPTPANIFQRTDIISSSVESLETTKIVSGTFSIGSLKNANFVDLVASLTTGYAANSPSAGRNVYNPYILLPEDELVLGLDAGITPPPDVAPVFGKNLYDEVRGGRKRAAQTAMINPILKNQIWHYAGNSYLRVLPGSAQLLLVGNYIREDNKIEYNRSKQFPDVTTVIGNDLITDQYENAEYDAYAGTYITQNFGGDIFDGTRKIISDDALRNSSSGGTIKLFKNLTNNKILILDQFISGVLQ